MNNSQWTVGLGLTAKVRDANIILESAEERVERTSVGVVPLPNFYAHWQFWGNVGLVFEGDAYAGPGGRAIDVHLAATVAVVESLKLRLGYRILDGGAGNERVYGFARFHYGAVGVTWSLWALLSRPSSTPTRARFTASRSVR